MKPTEWIILNFKNYQTSKDLIRACMRETGSSHESVRTQYRRFIKKINKPMEKQEKKQGLSEEEIMARHDINFIVRKVADELKEGEFLPEIEFIKLCGMLNKPGLRQALDSDEMIKYKGKASGGYVYYSHPDSIDKLIKKGTFLKIKQWH